MNGEEKRRDGGKQRWQDTSGSRDPWLLKLIRGASPKLLQTTCSVSCGAVMQLGAVRQSSSKDAQKQKLRRASGVSGGPLAWAKAPAEAPVKACPAPRRRGEETHAVVPLVI
ncbi:unnamed protein product [Prorocentrum cordatum]|uniref:Uncharacterized protein n=1 Tax=Prorocentrum cordatum TaxID=2364126 RepID=A0ABN9VGZ6_9DINO|nr:unnamed protein product [Polarella glacialis]